jgi:hypothetical protein
MEVVRVGGDAYGGSQLDTSAIVCFVLTCEAVLVDGAGSHDHT